ncbi:hypothetical protein K457DRAFT_1709998 [Linnemannia elongata AG-77]|uniref:Uncharacterized protein n=1 Tax=Linnemannia elongata AG-77 TaxID=1314771 RepID=A0A197KB67_9FUNG|nr:hypothetical protein K457DRAFT_1709998 [Linnemannia elongata AG-77]
MVITKERKKYIGRRANYGTKKRRARLDRGWKVWKSRKQKDYSWSQQKSKKKVEEGANTQHPIVCLIFFLCSPLKLNPVLLLFPGALDENRKNKRASSPFVVVFLVPSFWSDFHEVFRTLSLF